MISTNIIRFLRLVLHISFKPKAESGFLVVSCGKGAMKNISAVIFDVDGVLLDSLLPHLRICEDKNKEYNLGLTIPTADEFRKLIRRGAQVSPMKYFFEAVGFPSEYADKAVIQYDEVFVRDYSPKLFAQVGNMLTSLSQHNFKLGIITANVSTNLEAALGPSMEFFNPGCIFTNKDSTNLSKANALHAVGRKLNVSGANILYVGDQVADYLAAKEAGARFLGVIYGWGISAEDKDFPTVSKVMDIAQYLLSKAT